MTSGIVHNQKHHRVKEKEIEKLRPIASSWIDSENIVAIWKPKVNIWNVSIYLLLSIGQWLMGNEQCAFHPNSIDIRFDSIDLLWFDVEHLIIVESRWNQHCKCKECIRICCGKHDGFEFLNFLTHSVLPSEAQVLLHFIHSHSQSNFALVLPFECTNKSSLKTTKQIKFTKTVNRVRISLARLQTNEMATRESRVIWMY